MITDCKERRPAALNTKALGLGWTIANIGWWSLLDIHDEDFFSLSSGEISVQVNEGGDWWGDEELSRISNVFSVVS